MTTSMPGHSGRALPSLRRVSADYTDAATPIDIATAATTLLTCSELHACHNPVLVQATLTILERDTTVLRFMLFRDGVEIDSDERFGLNTVADAGRELVSLQWYDASPGVHPAYSVRALSDALVGADANQLVAYSSMAAFI